MANNRIVHFEIPARQPEALTGLWEQAKRVTGATR